MSEVLRDNPELPAPTPIEEISKFCTNIEFDSILLPEEQRRLYSPLLNSLKYAVGHDRYVMKYLDYQKNHYVNQRLSSSELFFINKSIINKYSTFDVTTEEQNEVFRTRLEGWAKKIDSPSIVAIENNNTPELIVRANYIGGTTYDNYVIPGTAIGAVRFIPDKSSIDELYVNSNDIEYSLQNNLDYSPISDYHAEILKNILSVTEQKIKKEYEQVVNFVGKVKGLE